MAERIRTSVQTIISPWDMNIVTGVIHHVHTQFHGSLIHNVVVAVAPVDPLVVASAFEGLLALASDGRETKICFVGK